MSDGVIDAVRAELRRLRLGDAAPCPGRPGWVRLFPGEWDEADLPAAGCLERLRWIPWPLRDPPTRSMPEARDEFWHKGGLWALLHDIEHPGRGHWAIRLLLPEA